MLVNEISMSKNIFLYLVMNIFAISMFILVRKHTGIDW